MSQNLTKDGKSSKTTMKTKTHKAIAAVMKKSFFIATMTKDNRTGPPKEETQNGPQSKNPHNYNPQNANQHTSPQLSKESSVPST